MMNFFRRIFSVCHSFRSMCQSGRMNGFERCFKVEDQGTWRRQNLHAAILRPPAKRIQIKLCEPHLGREKPVMGNIEPHLGREKPVMGNIEPLLRKEKPVMGNIEPLLGKEKPVMGNIEPLLGIRKRCQGNVYCRKSFAAEGFNEKIPFISQTYTKAVAISFRQSHARTRNLVKYHPRVVFTESFHAMEDLIDIATYR